MIENNILGVVLAGGKSKRFGDDKTTAKLGNKSLLDHTIEKIEKKFDEIKCIFNKRFNRRPSWPFSWGFVSYGMDKKE